MEMSFFFYYNGGSRKTDNGVFKFFLFSCPPNSAELFFHEAVTKGYVKRVNGLEHYASAFNTVKIFTSVEGFGLRKAYASFFFELDSSSPRVVRINPLGHDVEKLRYYFEGRGRFLSNDEIRERFGENSETWKFYLRQSYLTKAELKDIVTVKGQTDSSGKMVTVRKLLV